MLIGVVSDTHGRVPTARKAAVLLESLGVEKIIHCGDIDSPAIPSVFAAWETHYVQGNNDYDEFALRRAVAEAKGIWHGAQGSVVWANRTIAFLHGDRPAALKAASLNADNSLVCFGHTHCYSLQRNGETVVLNPGALHRANPYTFAVVDLATLDVHRIEVPRE
ncbi:MAG TPA: YfcE family phosphodiesterase [Pirellulales bacterium]